MSIQRSNPEELFDSTQYGFSQIVVAQGQRIVCVSGQVAWNARQELVGKSLFEQAHSALRNLQIALSAVQAKMEDIVSLRIYIVDLANVDSDEISRALKQSFAEGAYPAATWVGVTSLANPELKIEIEAMAVVASRPEEMSRS